MKFSSVALIAAISGVTNAFAPPTSQGSSRTIELSMSLEKYSDELRATATAMVAEGKGLLACDESTGPVGSRLESIGLENNEDNRREVRRRKSRTLRQIVSIFINIFLTYPYHSINHSFTSFFFACLIRRHHQSDDWDDLFA
jgi:hypothetical protein